MQFCWCGDFIEEVSFYENLKVSWQILLALVLGILLGSYLHYHSDSREWLIANLLSGRRYFYSSD